MNEEMQNLVDAAGFIFRGRVTAHETAEGGAGQNAKVIVEEILRSTEALRGLAGKEIALAGEHAGRMRVGDAYVILASVLTLGEHALLRDRGHFEASPEKVREIAEAVRVAEERPLRQRVAGAELIVNGRVTATRPAAPPSIRRSEHDPVWWIAQVAVHAVLKGPKPQKELEVLFANSDDRVWYGSPKLHEGASGIFLLRRADAHDVPKELEHTVYQAIDALDFLPLERLPEIERLLAGGKERR